MRDVETQETVNQRLNFLIQYYEAGNKSAFGRRANMKSGVVGDLVGGRMNKPSFEALVKIFTAYPSVSADWLLLGQGAMLRAGAVTEEPRRGYPYPADQHSTYAHELPSEAAVVALRYIRFKARADFSPAQQHGSANDPSDTVLFRLPPGRTAADYAEALVFDIKGDNLEPSLRDGQQVIAWPVPPSKWGHLHNTICVVAHDETVTIKAIRKNELAHDGLTLHATSGSGGSFTVARQDLHAIWEVREFYSVAPVRLL